MQTINVSESVVNLFSWVDRHIVGVQFWTGFFAIWFAFSLMPAEIFLYSKIAALLIGGAFLIRGAVEDTVKRGRKSRK